jgi:hypothetical protein
MLNAYGMWDPSSGANIFRDGIILISSIKIFTSTSILDDGCVAETYSLVLLT